MTDAYPRQRVIDHGEVFTPPGLVNDMLDLVASECEREDSRFLEPACGDGNFLAEVLRRRLLQVSRRHRSQSQWEAHALLGLACLYGIELLADNVEICRQRLVDLFWSHYASRFEAEANPAVRSSADCIVRCNILQGDALKMTSVPHDEPLVLTEWALVGRGRLKRRLYEYQELTPPTDNQAESLFASPRADISDEEGKPVFIANHVRDLPPIHYLELVSDGESR